MAQQTTIAPNTITAKEGETAKFTVTFKNADSTAKSWEFMLQRGMGNNQWKNALAQPVTKTTHANPLPVDIEINALTRSDSGKYQAVVTEITAGGQRTPYPSGDKTRLKVRSLSWQTVENIRFRWSAQKRIGSIYVQLSDLPAPMPNKKHDHLWRLSAEEFQAIASLWFNRASAKDGKLYYHSNLRLFGLASDVEGGADWPEPEE